MSTEFADNIIRVDRSVRPSYPYWIKTVIHPELEKIGPSKYDISLVKQWLHKDQKNGRCIRGNKIYTHFKVTDTLKTCLGLRDLEEIQKKGIVFFREHFQCKAVFGWKSVLWDSNGNLNVPYLHEDGGSVVIRWKWLDSDWNDGNPALRIASSSQR
ncbi:MAG: hypothetical protein UT80_C0042G0013 [Parcubacteria group bacterium GW2011_GWC1_40_13]|nr:MAG: hypothetical protein UT80_C0042G0013 [Parcubacteria group bacterium GW2011_GWC1_40_13]